MLPDQTHCAALKQLLRGCIDISKGVFVIHDKGCRAQSRVNFLSFDLNWQVSDSSRVSLAWEHVGRYYLDAANIHSYDGHNLAHLKGQIALDPATKLLFKINNLFDRHFAKRADYNTTTRNYRYFPGEPRHISVTLTRDF